MPHPTFPPSSVAVVTDGASGIGLAAAVRFARAALEVRVAGLGGDRAARAADVLAAAVPPVSWPWSVNRRRRGPCSGPSGRAGAPRGRTAGRHAPVRVRP